MQALSKKGRRASGVVRDSQVYLLKIKGKFQKTAVKTALIYGMEAAALSKTDGNGTDAAEMRMLRGIWSVTRTNRGKKTRYIPRL